MIKKTSVLVLTTSFPLDSTIAVGIHVIEKCRYLVKNGINVKVIAPHHTGGKRKEVIDGIAIRRFRYFFPNRWQRLAYGAGIPTNIKNSLLAKIQLPLFLLSFLISAVKEIKHYSIIHCHWAIAGLVGVIAGKLFKKRVVLMMHGAEVFVLGKNPILKFVLKNADYLISNSTFTEKKTLEVYPVANHQVISPGVDIKRFYPQKKIPNLRKILNISEEDIFILAIGKFIPRKGVEYLIKAFNVIVNQRKITNIKLRIGGRGPLKKKYETMIKDYGLNSYISFLEYIKDEEIPSYYTEADIFVLPSIVDDRGDTEGLGVVLLEATACQTPCIASAVGGIPDIIKDDINGFLVEQGNDKALADKIAQLIEDDELRKRLGEQGRLFVEKNFSWQTKTDDLMRLYQTILQR
jgi:glycosyltransferase involved in cell wall biosynthesis